MHRCMADLLSKLNSGRRSQRGIRRYLRTAKVSDNINKLRQRVQAVQDSFLVRDSLSYHCSFFDGQQIRTTTMTRLALSDVHEEVVALTGSVAASERNITSTIKDNINKIRIWVLGRARTCKIFRQDYRVLNDGVFIRGRYANSSLSTLIISSFAGLGCHSR